MNPIPYLDLDLRDSRAQELGQAALEALMLALRRCRTDVPATGPGVTWLRRLGVSRDGKPWLRVEHPVQATRQSGHKIASEPFNLPTPAEREVMQTENISYEELARRRWCAGNPRWHPLAEGLDLVLSERGPTAELERRRKQAEAELAGELESRAAAERQRKAEEDRRSEWARKLQLWEGLPRDQRVFLAAAAELPEYRQLLEALARLSSGEKVPMPSAWVP
jgi:hypothetical protein